MSINEYILENFKNSDKNEIKDSIVSAINDDDEITLPGMGVLFKILWKNSSNALQEDILSVLENNLKL